MRIRVGYTIWLNDEEVEPLKEQLLCSSRKELRERIKGCAEASGTRAIQDELSSCKEIEGQERETD
tara:strand:+ start:308 stop:505 length:198 start_codon:yes stop_codon:yes gene_type:complete